MDIDEFSKEIKEKMNRIQINIDDRKIEKFYKYMNLLLEWNKKMNLTAIVEPKEVILKHFVDCATILKYISKEGKVLDVGTGAGFPGIPLKILDERLDITLVDSLNKRITFLNNVIDKLGLQNMKVIHARAEDLAVKDEYREKYDILISRAVAPLNTLLEYMLPFVKIDGRCICMKGVNVIEEVNNSKKALDILKGNIISIEEIILPDTDIKRNIIIIRKIDKTPKQYPRKAGKPSKDPII